MKNNMKTFLRSTALGTSALCLMGSMAFAQNLIVDGSLCVGLDCLANESFGFDTIRMKENNLRLQFLDTSTAAAFPSADWRLIANDSANGGENKFSLEDSDAGRLTFTVEQGAPSNALYVDNGGRIGVGTANPSLEVHIQDGDTPSVRLEQDGSSGFNPQSWDMAGNETSFFIRDVTNGSTLPFRIFPGANSAALVVGANSNVGIGGDTTPDATLHVKATDGTAQILVKDIGGSGPLQMVKLENDGAVQLYMDNTSNASAQWMFSAGASMLLVPSDNPGDAVFDLSSTGDLQIDGTLTQSSDKHRKMAIEPVDAREILAKVRAMPVAEWTYKHDAETGIRHIGPMAQDFYAAFGTGADEKGISSLDGTGVALAAIQALSAENSELRTRLSVENGELRASLEALEIQAQTD